MRGRVTHVAWEAPAFTSQGMWFFSLLMWFRVQGLGLEALDLQAGSLFGMGTLGWVI